MTAASETGGQAYREKRGNTSWVRCPKCKEWHHVALPLLQSTTVKAHCPACHHEFLCKDAAEIANP